MRGYKGVFFLLGPDRNSLEILLFTLLKNTSMEGGLLCASLEVVVEDSTRHRNVA
jgi:hypothetical protein